MKNRLQNIFVMLICTLVIGALSLIPSQVFATDAVELKMAFAGLKTCYTEGGINKNLSANYNANALTYGASNSKIKIALPSGKELTCQQLIYGGNGFSGLMNMASGVPNISDSPDKKGAFLTKLGYSAENSNQKSCATFVYDVWMDNDNFTTRTTICAQTTRDSSGAAIIDTDQLESTMTTTKSNGEDYGFTIGGLHIYKPWNLFGSKTVECNDGANNKIATVPFAKGDNWNQFIDELINSGCAKEKNVRQGNLGSTITSTRVGIPERDPGNAATAEYTIEGRESTAADTAIKFLSNNQVNPNSLGLSEYEKATLLQGYLANVFNATNAGCNLTGDALKTAEADGYIKARIDNGNGFQDCYIKPANKNKEVFGWNSGSILESSETWGFDKVVEELNSLTIDSLPDSSGTPTLPDSPSNGNTATPGDGSNDGQDGTLSTCFENAGVLGWIVCPVTEALGNVVGGIYEYIEMNYLQVRSDVIDSSGLREGWTTFRDFANILFAIAFTVVIFAQITGFGISNYNIKKILPRLLVIVVLVNISFILCQLATDISNIVGASIKDMFVDFASKARTQLDYNIPSIVGGFLGALGLVSGLSVGVIALGMTINWRLWIFPLLLSLGGCLLGVLFFFIILGVRQAGIIILIVLAPLAIVCYALPNTKNLFDKWWKMFSALLILYPICGALMGGGQFASALLLNTVSDSEGGLAFMSIVAMLLNVMPFFLVPSLLKSSMAAMGNIGTKISQFGQKQTGRLQGAIRGSQGFKDLQWGQQFKTDNAQVKRFQGKLEKKGKLSQGNQRRANMFMQRLAKSQRELAVGGDLKNAITIGSEAERNLRSSVQRQQANEDVLGRQGRYINGEMTSILPGREDQIVNGRNADELGAELDAYLDKIIAGDGSAEELENYNRNAQAIINALSDMNTAGSRAKVINSLAKNVSKHSGKLTGPLDEQEKARLKGSFGRLQSSIEKYAKDYKKDNPESPRLVGDLAAGEFKNAGKLQELSDQENPNSTFWRSSAYVDKGLSGMNTEDFSKLKPQALQSILHGMRNGEVSSRSINTLARIADEALSPDSIFKPDADSYRYIEQIRSAAYAHGAMADGSTTRSVGSQAIGRASSTSLRSITSEIKSAPSWQDLSANAASSDPAVKAAATADMTKYSNLVTNIQQSLASDMHSEETAAQLQEALQIAHDKGFQDTSGQVVRVNKISPQNLKLQHSTQQPAPAPRTPTSTPSQNSNNILTRNPDGTLSGKVGPVVVSGAEESPGGLIIVQEDADIRTRRQQQQQNRQNNNQNNNP